MLQGEQRIQHQPKLDDSILGSGLQSWQRTNNVVNFVLFALIFLAAGDDKADGHLGGQECPVCAARVDRSGCGIREEVKTVWHM